MSEATGGLIHASPTKDFFVTMITRDIPLTDCIFDLVDNSIDAARRHSNKADIESLNGYFSKIAFDRDKFNITDNCGGISLADAVDHAFHFGRKRDDVSDGAKSIGLYGIGMKRAIFKLGRLATIQSETEEDSFEVKVDVDTWATDDDDWDFQYRDRKRQGSQGTVVEVEGLYPSVSNTFMDPTFKTELIKALARDYAFFIAKGFAIEINGTAVPRYSYELKQGADLAPALVQYVDDTVSVRIVAGLVDELADEIPDELRPEKVDRYGWFVVCNDRVVLAADTTERTIWGDDGFQIWHPQYNGFAGFAFFEANDAKKLPWTTTKREVDLTDPIYRRAVGRMKEVTLDFIAYSNRRKSDLEFAKEAERNAVTVEITKITEARPMSFPRMLAKAPRRDTVTISYSKPKVEVKEIAGALGYPGMSASEVGRETFDYFRRVELGKK